MLPRHAAAPQSPRRFGVGIDTSRYGHYGAFLRDDLQPAAAELSFAESPDGYAKLRQCLERLAVRHPYADNLLHFLHHLADRSPATASPLAGRSITLSCGDPHRNKSYRAALFG